MAKESKLFSLLVFTIVKNVSKLSLLLHPSIAKSFLKKDNEILFLFNESRKTKTKTKTKRKTN